MRDSANDIIRRREIIIDQALLFPVFKVGLNHFGSKLGTFQLGTNHHHFRSLGRARTAKFLFVIRGVYKRCTDSNLHVILLIKAQAPNVIRKAIPYRKTRHFFSYLILSTFPSSRKEREPSMVTLFKYFHMKTVSITKCSNSIGSEQPIFCCLTLIFQQQNGSISRIL